jgi:hypothetical protein
MFLFEGLEHPIEGAVDEPLNVGKLAATCGPVLTADGAEVSRQPVVGHQVDTIPYEAAPITDRRILRHLLSQEAKGQSGYTCHPDPSSQCASGIDEMCWLSYDGLTCMFLFGPTL